MKIVTKHSIKNGKTLIPKGTEGLILRIENSYRIKEIFPNIDYKTNDWYYIIEFPEIKEYPCLREEIEII